MTKDPVCQMNVEESKAASSVTYNGTTYYFCSQGCRDKFDKNPKQYAGK